MGFNSYSHSSIFPTPSSVPVSLQLYDLDNTVYDEVDVVQIYYDVTERYKKENPKFIGAKIIYAPLRFASDEGFLHYVDVCKRLVVSTRTVLPYITSDSPCPHCRPSSLALSLASIWWAKRTWVVVCSSTLRPS